MEDWPTPQVVQENEACVVSAVQGERDASEEASYTHCPKEDHDAYTDSLHDQKRC